MSDHAARISWHFTGESFLKGYSREHSWTFDGGAVVPASPAPVNVPAPWSNPAAVDPEEAFVASISSCHMLTFLWLAYQRGFEVLSYVDDAVGTMTPNEHGVPWVSHVVLRPAILYGSASPNLEQEAELHHLAHTQCFIANSVKTEISVSSQLTR
ncbi:MAG: OsmC family protein [Polyangiaceae bacterium]